MAATFKLKRGNAALWASTNPILAEGEPGWAFDTGELRIGDGVTNWNDLVRFVNVSGMVTVAHAGGVLTLDCSTGSVFLVTLTGNATGINFTNPAGGQQMEVHFIQGGSGGFTTTFANSVKLSGNSFVPAAAVGGRDILVVRSVGAGNHEISRSMAVSA